ncbi:MAG: ABC transporter substrate-binding protein [Gammaproteobacteria bacterium]|nr:ABC transporter substrate-binding protein [Gammaproteobacteria bacterium]
MMLKCIQRSFVAFLGMCLLSTAIAASDPVTQLSQTADKMIEALKTNKTAIKSNPAMTESLARQILLPQVDVELMAKLALGRNGWNNASSQQRADFTRAFTTLMVRTYAAAFAAYTDEVVKFYPLRPGDIEDGRVQIKSEILQSGGPAIPVNYRLLQQGNDWKVYDINVDGVSLIQSFQSQFSGQLAQGGMDQLLVALNKHNSELKK